MLAALKLNKTSAVGELITGPTSSLIHWKYSVLTKGWFHNFGDRCGGGCWSVCPFPVYLISQERLEVWGKLQRRTDEILVVTGQCDLIKKKKARTPRNPSILQTDTSVNSNSNGAWKHNRSETVWLVFHPALVQLLCYRSISCVEKEA